jgi:adenylate kinase
MLNLVLFGPPGAGKGTQSQKLIEKYQLIHLSTGDLLRSQIAAGTELGLRAKTLMDQGLLVPDEVVIGMIENQLQQNEGTAGFIFDGFPRTVPQAEALDRLLSAHHTAISMMIALEVSEEELTKRLLNRGLTSGRSDDVDEALIRRRVQEYVTKTAPVANYYGGQKKFFSIIGIGSVEDIFGQICQIIDSHQELQA